MWTSAMICEWLRVGCLAVALLGAQEVQPEEDAPVEEPKATAPPPVEPNPGGEPTIDDLPDDDLLDKLDPTKKSPLDEAREKLEAAIETMRSAKDRLTDSDTGNETRALQTRAADDLEKILELLKQPPPPSQQSKSQNQNQNQNQDQNPQQSRNQRQQQRQQQGRQQQSRQRQSGRQSQRRQSQSKKPRGPQGQQQAASNQPQPTPGERNDQANESDDRLDPAKKKAEEEARRRADANDVWGHLPPNVREALQKSFNERYLPKYEELVRRYYESLAEKKRDRP